MDINSLFEDEKYIKKIFSTIREGILVVNWDLIVVFINEATEKLGLKKEKVLNESIFSIFPNLEKENSTIVKVFSTGKPIKEKIQVFITYRGERKTTITSTYPIKKNGKIVGVYEIFEDISGLNNMSEKLILNQKNQTKENKTSTISKPKTDTGKFHTLDSIIGKSSIMNSLKERATIFANSPSPILVYGETGTGKELIAQSIYSLSRDSKTQPFIAQNCAAIPESLLESILFGTVKGAFTGAEDRPGLFELANEGVLFLDEINSMPKNLQAKILRVIQEGQVRRIGGNKEISVNFRLISSTNVMPEKLLEAGEIREDLYYRLNVLYIEIPPLRARKEDIPLLVQHFIQEFNEMLQKQVVGVDQRTMNFFMTYEWPGNVRELKNIIERSMNIAKGKIIKFNEIQSPTYLTINKEIKSDIRIKNQERIRLREAVKDLEISIIKKAIQQTSGNISKAARDLDIPQQTLNNKIDRYHLRPFIKSMINTQK